MLYKCFVFAGRCESYDNVLITEKTLRNMQVAIYTNKDVVGYMAGSNDSFGPVVARNSEVLDSSPGRLCIYSALNCSKTWSVQYCL